ncbi:MAG: ADP-ribosylglycohydrolase family protein [Deltaproteobacteria bacterium]|nr:ADP-ribosylglycohydrolase family protein [Deltaproteobacteria bacterium]
MKNRIIAQIFFCVALLLSACAESEREVTISLDVLKDKIKGAWAAQTIGVTYGGPTEFRYNGTIIHDYQPILWYDGFLKETYEIRPGLYDDIYMDLTFVDVFEKEGLDAPASAFALAFANADYILWHANQAARYNILHGIMPPESGYWMNNPHADDIDFQIEADFAGIMSPGLVNTASEICDKIGHIMNYGDGWYGGVYMAAMYALAFVSDDIEYIVEEALKVIPAESQYAATMRDVIRWHAEDPDDWKATWFKVLRKWGNDIGCPKGVFNAFNIDAKINSAWVLLGLLYGDGDFGKTLSISTRAGDDSDCNPASAAGILGTILGYEKIPDYWKQGLHDVEDVDLKYTTISLNDVYILSFKHALENIKRNGGTVDENRVTIPIQTPASVKYEVSFPGYFPVEKRRVRIHIEDSYTFDFEGIGFAMVGGVEKTGKRTPILRARVVIDGLEDEIVELPSDFRLRRFTPFWKYGLERGAYTVQIKMVNPSPAAKLQIQEIVIYDDRPIASSF